MNAQTNFSHPWHQHWAETICCQQLSLLAQTLAPEGGARLKSQTKSENLKTRMKETLFSFIAHQIDMRNSVKLHLEFVCASVDLLQKIEANRGRRFEQEVVVSLQLINNLTKTIYPTQSSPDTFPPLENGKNISNVHRANPP